MEYRVQFMKITNKLNKPLEIALEPMGFPWTIDPGQVARIGTLCPVSESVSMEISAGRVTVWEEGNAVWFQDSDGRLVYVGGGPEFAESQVIQFPD